MSGTPRLALLRGSLLVLCGATATVGTGIAAEVGDEIFVTGSRIARKELTANTPITVVDAESIKLSGKVNVEEYLRELPQFAPAIGGNSNNGNPGVATIDLRNLKEERTLVLMNGKRFIPYDPDGIVDINMIPTALIERVEVITGGASSTYGTDAVAGVVNFILKEDFEGAEFDASTGISEEGDSERYDFSATLGGAFAGGRGNVVVNVGYSKQEPVTQGERSYSLFSLDNLLEPGGSGTTENGGVIYTELPGDPLEGFAEFDADGNLVPFGDGFNFNPFNLLRVPQQQWNITALGSYELTPDVEFFSRLSFSNNRVSTRIAPTGTFFEQFNLNYATNPFIGADARDTFALVDAAEEDENGDPAPTANDGNVDILLGRRLVELGTRDSEYENTAYQAVGGFRGEIFNAQRWELFGQYGRTSRSQNLLGDTSLARARQAVRAIDDGLGGVVCEDPSFGCQPANYFGAGNLSPEAAAFLRLDLVETNKTDQMVLGGSLTGDLPFTFPMASSPMAYAAGLEFRRDQGESRPDGNYSTGNAIGFGASSPVDAEIEIAEVFAEIRLPLLEGRRFAEVLALEAGIRQAAYDNKVETITESFSNDFDNTSWKIGAEWAPISALRFRGAYAEAVRAPNLTEIGLPRTASTGDLDTDPCEGTNPVGDPDLTALCIATGVPPGAIGSVVSIIAGQVNNFIGGDPGLEPEEAETWTLGFVWTPASLPLTLAVDYYKIEIDNAITQVAEQNVVDACYNVEQDPNGFFCSRIFRNTLNGGLIGPKTFGVDVTQINAAKETSEGVDIAATYGFDLGDRGTVNVGVNAAYMIEHIIQDAATFPANDCTGLVGAICLRPYYEWNIVTAAQWAMGPWTAGLRWQYLDGVTQDAIALGGTDPADFAKPSIGSYSYFDLSGSYDINEMWSVRASIDNLFDRDPPVVGNEYGGTTENSGNTFPAVYDPIGRYFTVGVTARF